MPISGVHGRLYEWCCVCRGPRPEQQSLSVHLKTHGLELIPGCSECFYFRLRWSDVKKHAASKHGLDLDAGEGPVRWGVTVRDVGSQKPTYASRTEDEVCLYPREEEEFPATLTRILRRAAGGPDDDRRPSRAPSPSPGPSSRRDHSPAGRPLTRARARALLSSAASPATSSSTPAPEEPPRPLLESPRPSPDRRKQGRPRRRVPEPEEGQVDVQTTSSEPLPGPSSRSISLQTEDVPTADAEVQVDAEGATYSTQTFPLTTSASTRTRGTQNHSVVRAPGSNWEFREVLGWVAPSLDGELPGPMADHRLSALSQIGLS